MRRHLIVLGLLLFISLPTFLCRNLWNPDEPRYAQVASEMTTRSDYLVPHLNREVYPEKPPVFFWLIIAAKKIFGREYASRAISLLAALLVAFMTYLIGQRLLGEEEGFLGALVLITSGMFVVLAQVGNMDTLLTLSVTLALFCFLESLSRKKRGRWLVLSYLFMALGTLTKGPVALALAYPVILVWLIHSRGKGIFKERHLLWGPLLALFIVGLWFAPACLKGGSQYFQVIMKRQIAGRALDTWSHRQPFFYYLIVFPLVFLPWSGLIPGALKSAWRSRKDPELFLIVWALVIFVFFSIISSKRERYLLPLYPAASLLAGRWLVELSRRKKGPTSPFLFFILASICVGALYFLPLDAAVRPIEKYFRSEGGYALLKAAGMGLQVLVIAVAALGLSIAGIYASRRGMVRAAVGYVVALIILFSFSINFTVLKRLDRIKSFRSFTEEVKTKLNPGEELKLWRRWFSGAVNLYMGKGFIETLYEEFQFEHFGRYGRTFSVIFARKDFRELGEYSKARLKILARGKNGNLDLVLVRFTPRESDLLPSLRKRGPRARPET